jgi:hypothetical protein
VNFYEKFNLDPFVQVARAFSRSKIAENSPEKKHWFKGTFMMFMGGDYDHKTLFYFNIKELFSVLGWRCS